MSQTKPLSTPEPISSIQSTFRSSSPLEYYSHSGQLLLKQKYCQDQEGLQENSHGEKQAQTKKGFSTGQMDLIRSKARVNKGLRDIASPLQNVDKASLSPEAQQLLKRLAVVKQMIQQNSAFGSDQVEERSPNNKGVQSIKDKVQVGIVVKNISLTQDKLRVDNPLELDYQREKIKNSQLECEKKELLKINERLNLQLQSLSRPQAIVLRDVLSGQKRQFQQANKRPVQKMALNYDRLDEYVDPYCQGQKRAWQLRQQMVIMNDGDYNPFLEKLRKLKNLLNDRLTTSLLIESRTDLNGQINENSLSQRLVVLTSETQQ